MISNKINWHILFYSAFKHKLNPDLKIFLESSEFKDICNNLLEKSVIVLWWDGTMLRSIKQYYHLNLPFLWINLWNKWFLLNKKNYITKKSKFIKSYFPIIKATVTTWKNKYSDIFFNEINITAWWWKMLDLDIILSNKNKINIKWDWILICTPAGSTGYNSSLRWPIIPHNVSALAITPKAPWHPRWQHPIILSDNEKIEIIKKWRPNIIECYTDSRELFIWKEENVKIIIEKISKPICFLIDSNYKHIWDNKVLLEQWFE